MDNPGDLAAPVTSKPPAEAEGRFAAGLATRLAALLWLERFAHYFVLALIIVGAWYVLFALGALIPGWPLNPYLGQFAALLPWILAGAPLAASILGTPGLRRTALIMDERAATADRLTTALQFARAEAAGPLSPWQTATLRESREYLSQVRFARHLRFPKAARLGGIGLAVMALAMSLQMAGPRESRVDPKDKTAVVAEEARLKELAKKMDEVARTLSEEPDQAAKEMAAKLRQAAKDLAAQKAPKAEELRAAALRQLAALEAATRAELDRRAEVAKLDSQDARALGEALKASPEFAKAGQSLTEGKTSKAAQEIKDTLSRLNEQAKKDAIDAVSAALSRQDPITRPNNPKAAEKNAGQKAMRALASQQSAEAMQAMKEIADLLREMGALQDAQSPNGADQPGKPGGGQMSKQSLAKLLQALQNMKDQARGGDGSKMLWPSGDQGGDDAKENMIFMSGNDPGNQPGNSTAMMSTPISTPDTSEGMDSGTAEPLGDKPFDTGHINKSEGVKLNGLLGEGESLLTLTPGAAPGTKASTRYQEVYQAAEPAMQEALNREDIPLGSRELIKRYFEEIRP